MKYVLNFVKKFILSFLLLYTYNKLTLPFDLIIPINFVTLLLVTFFGIPAIIMLVLFYLVCL